MIITTTLYNIKLDEARWLFTNGLYVKFDRENETADVYDRQYIFAKTLRKWWKWKMAQREQKETRVKFINITD